MKQFEHKFKSSYISALYQMTLKTHIQTFKQLFHVSKLSITVPKALQTLVSSLGILKQVKLHERDIKQ